MHAPQVDDEEVSLSNSSLDSYDDDTSDEEDEEAELDESLIIDQTSSSSFGGGISASSDDGEKDDSNDQKIASEDRRFLFRRNHTVAHLPPRPGSRDKQQQRLDSATIRAFGNDEYRKATKLDQKVSLAGVNSTLSAEALNQHVLLSQACLELLEERDRYDAMRRLNLRRSLNCTTISEDEANEEDEEYPLLSLIKSGPLYKLHVKGGTATKKIRSKKENLKSKLIRSSSTDVVGGSAATESSLLTSWKHKYVEVRKGMLSYYANSTSSLPTKSNLVRKNVTLEVSTSVCRAINLEEGDSSHSFEMKNKISSSLPPKFGGKTKASQLFAFELVVNGETRVWASRSEAGRQSWIKVINRGMIGRSVKDEVRIAKNDPNAERQLQCFLDLSKKRAKNFSADAKDVPAVGQEFAVLWGTSVEVPVKSLFADESERMRSKTQQTTPRDELACFWRNLENLNVELNGELFQASSLCCPHRVFGFLTRSILEHDRASVLTHQSLVTKITEIQASKYARDCLRSVGENDEKIAHLRTAVGVLCGDKNDAVAIEDAKEPLSIIKINVTSNKHQISLVQQNLSVDRREWVHVRRKKSKSARRYFAVLSVGVLCLYKEEFPRPHKLQSQLLLVGADIGTREQSNLELSSHTNEDVSSHSSGFHSSTLSNDGPASPSLKNPSYTIYIKGRENGKWVERQLCFTKFETFAAWRDVLVNAIETSSSTSNVLSFDDGVNEQSTGEVHVDQKSTPPGTSSPDVDGISWIPLSAASAAGDLHVRSSRLQNIKSRFLESIPPLPTLQISSPKFGDRKRSHPVSLLSSQLSRKMLSSRTSSSDLTTPTPADDITEEKPSRATVEIEMQVTKLYTVFLNDAVGPSMCTIRSAHTEKFACSGGKKGRLEKKQALIKLETLRGNVDRDAFKLAFDSKSVPRRRKTI